MRSLASYDIWDIRSPYIYCGLLQDVHIFGRSFVYAKTGAYVFQCQSYQNYQHFLFSACADAFIEARRHTLFTKYIEDECIFLGGMGVEITPEGPSHLLPGGINFGHFIFEYLNRLAIFDACGLLQKLPVVVYDFIPKRWLGFLELLGIPEHRLIRIPTTETPAYRKVWVSSACHYRSSEGPYHMWGEGLYWLRARLWNAVGGPQLAARRRIYLGRGAAIWRKISNEGEVKQLLAAYGFEFPAMDQMTAREQVEMMSGAEIVIAAAGAGTCVTQFAPSHCIVILLAPRGVSGIWGGQAAATHLRQVYKWIECEPEENAEFQRENLSGDNELANFRVDIDGLRARLEAALNLIATGVRRDALKL